MIAIDIEASGLEPEKNSILSIGAVDTENPSNTFYDECRVWEGAKIEEEALAINGFSEKDARDPEKKSEAELIAAFFAWADGVGERTLVAQNVSFDHGFLQAAAHRAGIAFPFAKRTLDVHTLVWLHMTSRGEVPPSAHGHSALNSKAIQQYCGIPEEAMPHNALTGALWHAEVVSRIAYTKKLVAEYEKYDIPWTNQ